MDEGFGYKPFDIEPAKKYTINMTGNPIEVVLSEGGTVKSCLSCHCFECAERIADLRDRIDYLEGWITNLSIDLKNLKEAVKK